MTVTMRKTTCRVCGAEFMLDSTREKMPGIGCHPETCMRCELRKMNSDLAFSDAELDDIVDLVNRDSALLAAVPPAKKGPKHP